MRRGGFEPPKSETAVLQTASVDRLDTDAWWDGKDLNLRRGALQAPALPTELPSLGYCRTLSCGDMTWCRCSPFNVMRVFSSNKKATRLGRLKKKPTLHPVVKPESVLPRGGT